MLSMNLKMHSYSYENSSFYVRCIPVYLQMRECVCVLKSPGYRAVPASVLFCAAFGIPGSIRQLKYLQTFDPSHWFVKSRNKHGLSFKYCEFLPIRIWMCLQQILSSAHQHLLYSIEENTVPSSADNRNELWALVYPWMGRKTGNKTRAVSEFKKEALLSANLDTGSLQSYQFE